MREFSKDRRGNVTVTFALSLVPILGLAGAAIDYSRAFTLRGELQHAADSAVLAAALAPDSTLAGVQSAGASAFKANFPGAGHVVISMPADQNGAVVARATAKTATTLLQVIGIKSIDVAVKSTARSSSGASAIEVALVLDNTGSMVNDMAGLKSAAKSLTQTLFRTAGKNAAFKMSVVPYVAAVNPGKTLLSGNGYAAMDTTADAAYHGAPFRGVTIATNISAPGVDCYSDYPVYGGGGGGPPLGNGGGSDKKVEIDIFEPVSRIANELFGIKPAHAFNETPNTVPVLSGNSYNPGGDRAGPEFLPNGFTAQTLYPGAHNKGKGCDFLLNPSKINYFDLFNRIPSTTKSGGLFAGWKGCVEARPEPYDATDDAPGSDPAGLGFANTKFVPYFAPDEADLLAPGGNNFANNWLDDGYLDPAAAPGAADRVGNDPTGSRTGRSDNGNWNFRYNEYWRTKSLLKYNGTNKPDIKDFYDSFGNHITTGPNANCPDEVLPLTNVQGTVIAKINSLTHWSGGGTVTSEGLAWGWRTLSPNPPYAIGQPYDAQKTQKVIVLMTDGRNDLITNTNSSVISEFTAYGYLADWRMGANYAAATDYLNTRMMAVCANAKAKPGVSIYTVLFRETDPTITKLLQSCASSPSMAFTASNAAALETAFSKIAGSISQLRLTE